MTELQQTRYDQLMRRVGGLIGPGSKVSEVITELFPMIEVEDTTPELLALSGWRIAWQSTELGGSVGDVSTIQLFNPVDSGVLAAVTGVLMQVNVGGFVLGGINETLLGGAAIRGAFRDSRFGGDRETTLFTQAANALAVGLAGGFIVRPVVDEPLSIRDDNGLVVLAPGSGLVFQTGSTNVRLTVTWFWRERPAEPSELSF